MEARPRFDLLTREHCHLCDEMRSVLDRVVGRAGEGYRLVNVDSDPALADRFGNVVPVLLRDGKPVAKVRLTESQLRRIIRRRRFWRPAGR